MSKRLLSDEELNFLAESYIKLKANKTYQNMSTSFQQFIGEFLEKELLAIKKIREEK